MIYGWTKARPVRHAELGPAKFLGICLYSKEQRIGKVRVMTDLEFVRVGGYSQPSLAWPIEFCYKPWAKCEFTSLEL